MPFSTHFLPLATHRLHVLVTFMLMCHIFITLVNGTFPLLLSPLPLPFSFSFLHSSLPSSPPLPLPSFLIGAVQFLFFVSLVLKQQ